MWYNPPSVSVATANEIGGSQVTVENDCIDSSNAANCDAHATVPHEQYCTKRGGLERAKFNAA